VLSCDNLLHNGDVARKAVLSFASRRDGGLAKWLEANGAFPNTMVDRITPVTTAEQRAMLAREFGVEDACPVFTEPFRQWIVQDRFCNQRPEWESVGAVMTGDVFPYEKIKLRLLNASHQALCYLGILLGYRYVHEAIADSQIRTFVGRLMDEEISPLVDAVPGIDLAEYKKTVIERFSNPAIRDSLARIGTDASTRIAKFVLPSIAEQVARGGPHRLLSLAVAGWLRCLVGTDDNGAPIELGDPLGDKLTSRARSGGVDPGALLGVTEVFGAELSASTTFRANLSCSLGSLYRNGARATLGTMLAPVSAA
jgi:mannitol 2-dehydrogenase